MSLVKAQKVKVDGAYVFEHSFNIVREGNSHTAYVQARTTIESGIDDEKKLRDCLKAAITRWCKETPEGQTLYRYSGGDLNIGDLASGGSMKEVLARFPGCISFEVDIPLEATDWVFDTCLCDELPEEEE